MQHLLYTKSRDGFMNCGDRYKRGDENVKHHFVWIVPEKFKSADAPTVAAARLYHRGDYDCSLLSMRDFERLNKNMKGGYCVLKKHFFNYSYTRLYC